MEIYLTYKDFNSRQRTTIKTPRYLSILKPPNNYTKENNIIKKHPEIFQP